MYAMYKVPATAWIAEGWQHCVPHVMVIGMLGVCVARTYRCAVRTSHVRHHLPLAEEELCQCKLRCKILHVFGMQHSLIPRSAHRECVLVSER